MLSRLYRSLLSSGNRSVPRKTLGRRNAATVSEGEEVSEVEEEDINVEKTIKPKEPKHKDKSSYILDFFNSCDYITLNRLARSSTIKKSSINNYLLPNEMIKIDQDTEIIKTDQDTAGRQRYVDIDEFCNKNGFSEPQISTLADLVLKFETAERHQRKMASIFYPSLEIPKTNLTETVVTVDFFLNNVVWSEQEVSSRLVTKTGHFLFVVKDNKKFDHVKHGQQMQQLIEQLPDTPLYLLNNRSGMFSRDRSGLTQYQHLMEAVFMTHMNCKSNTDISDSNNVILFTPRTLDAFYNLKFGQEVEMIFPLMQSWYRKHESPIDGMYMLPNVEQEMFAPETDERIRERLIRCIFMSDAVSRILRRKEKKFPRFYSD